MEQSITLQEFYDMLDKHDWHYVMTEDRRAYSVGKESEQKIKRIVSGNGFEFHDLLQAFEDYKWQGPPFNISKPERPGESKLKIEQQIGEF